MRRTPFPWIAAVSVLAASAAIGTLNAARRPRYGGELRIELRAQLKTLDPQEMPQDPLALAAQRQILPAVFETLVRLDEHGEPQPWLAESWTHDLARKGWIFTARRNVTLQDGTLWSPLATSLVVPDNRPLDQILRELARPRNAVVVRAADGSLIGTGPFRIAKWEPEKSVTLQAHDRYWGGRPYLDSIRIQMGRAFSEQAVDFQVGNADVVEIGLRDLRAPRARGITVFTTAPLETLALQFENRGVPDAVREAVALSIDRAAIHSVLLQRQGEVSGALLPQWLSGYSFVFPVGRNVARAHQIAPAPATLNFAYDRQDPVIRSIAERVAVNASEVGITLRPAGENAGKLDRPAALSLIQLPVTSRDPWAVLEEFAALLKLPSPVSTSLYDAESAMLESFQVIPLFHLPHGWMMQSRVKDWAAKDSPSWADAWLDAGATP
jgi:MarR-like DNA-binding transcriptional regulator SgrR of sgrS sRNA